MHLELLRLQGNVVEIGRGQLLLAHGAVAMRSKPHCDALLAELVSTDCQDANREGRLADDTHLLFLWVGLSFLEVDDCQ